MSRDGGQRFLFLRQRHALEDSVVAAAQALRLVGGQMRILIHLAVVHDHTFTGDAGDGVLHECGGDMYRGLRNDMTDPVADQHLHRDAGIGLYGIGIVYQCTGDAVRDFVRVRRIHFFDHLCLLLALNSFSMASSWGLPSYAVVLFCFTTSNISYQSRLACF